MLIPSFFSRSRRSFDAARSRAPARAAALAAAAAWLAACSSSMAPPPEAVMPEPTVPTHSTLASGHANLASASGSLVSGRIVLTPRAEGGVRATGTLGGLPPNATHGLHVHERGDCSTVDAASAGPLFDPFGRRRDIDNIGADADGVAQVDAVLPEVTLGGGAVNDILGRALVVRVAADPRIRQATGLTAVRVACGVIAGDG